jgi:CubicO group peptidase (beta-lactamase class C family)
MYAATVTEVDGVRLLRPETVDNMSVVQTSTSTPYGQEPDAEQVDWLSLSLGFYRPSPWTRLLGPCSFGHPGAGGSLGFGDPALGIGFAYVMNRMSSGDDPRSASLVSAVAECLG